MYKMPNDRADTRIGISVSKKVLKLLETLDMEKVGLLLKMNLMMYLEV